MLWSATGRDCRSTDLTFESRRQQPRSIQALRFLGALDSIGCRIASFGPLACGCIFLHSRHSVRDKLMADISTMCNTVHTPARCPHLASGAFCLPPMLLESPSSCN